MGYMYAGYMHENMVRVQPQQLQTAGSEKRKKVLQSLHDIIHIMVTRLPAAWYHPDVLSFPSATHTQC